MSTKNLTEQQRERLGRLEPQLKRAVSAGNIDQAKQLVLDIQDILRPTGHETRLMQIKNWLYEAAIQAEEYGLAIEGLKGVKQKTNKNTRVHLEATALLAIAYLRKADIANAEPYIKEVLINDRVIKTPHKRQEFRKSIIERFNEEITLFSLKGTGSEGLVPEEIQELALKQSQNASEKEMYFLIGYAMPENVISSVFKIDDFSKKQLPTAERLKLPSPTENTSRDKIGETLFSSIKRTLYKSLCDPESDIYKAWFKEGLQVLLTKKYITGAVIGLLTGLGIGIKAIAASVVALILKFGIEVYCTHNKPKGVMDLR